MNDPSTHLRFVTASFVCAMLLILLLADQGTMPAFIGRLYAFPHGDSEVLFRKVGHFLLMGLLSFLVNLTLARTRIARQKTSFSWRNLLLASLVLSVIVTIEEFSQVLFRSRSFSLSDLFFSLLGIWFFACLAAGFAGKIRNKQYF